MQHNPTLFAIIKINQKEELNVKILFENHVAVSIEVQLLSYLRILTIIVFHFFFFTPCLLSSSQKLLPLANCENAHMKLCAAVLDEKPGEH
jgi:hypothetical protein